MSVQSTIYEIKLAFQKLKAERLKHEGIEVSYKNADSIWKDAVVEQIHYLISHGKGHEFTSDDVLIPLHEKGIFTHTDKALGGIMQSFSRTKQIEATGLFRASTRISRHRAPIRIWRVV